MREKGCLELLKFQAANVGSYGIDNWGNATLACRFSGIAAAAVNHMVFAALGALID